MTTEKLFINVQSGMIPKRQKWKQLKCPSTDEWIDKHGITMPWNYSALTGARC